MEGIASSLDKLLAKYNESASNCAPRTLSSEHINDSHEELATASPCKKRRYSETLEKSSLDVSKIENIVSTESSDNISIMNPWENRLLKADLIEAKVKLTNLKQEMERMQKLHAEKEILLESRLIEEKKKCESSINKADDLEKHLQAVRVRERQTKQELKKLQHELQQHKQACEETIWNLQKTNRDIKESARTMKRDMANQLSKCRSHAEKVESEWSLNVYELETLKQKLKDYKLKASAYDEMKLLHEQIEQDLNISNSRIKDLELQISLYEDWKDIMENKKNLANIPSNDEELERLRVTNRRLQELLRNKLLLEEKVHHLQSRVDSEDKVRSDLATLQVQLKYTQDELKEWIKVAESHCPPNTLISPLTLRTRIEELLQNDIVVANEKANKNSENKTMESELLTYKQKCKIYEKNIEELNITLKRHKILKERIQKKLLVVSKERDCYKQLSDNFEKDLTITNTTASETSNTEVQLKHRIELLEKVLNNYKEFCYSLEKQLSTVKIINSGDGCEGEQNVESNLSIESTAGYDYMKKELATLRLENERLHRRKEELELELEHYYLQGDFNKDKYKVVHMINNPAAEAYKLSTNLIEKLQAEIERLKRKNKNPEKEFELGEIQQNDTDGMTVDFKEINQLKSEVESLNSKMKKMKECYKAASTEFRDVVYMLLGYRIDRGSCNKNYTIMSMFAESPDHYLSFRLNELNSLEMLETPYSVSLKPMIETPLEGTKSLPAFLSTLTLELFQRATVTIP